MRFSQLFFRIYDRKVLSGEITFSQTGISKEDFTRLCTEEDFVFDEETLAQICRKMNLDSAERDALFEAARRKD